jgi:multidrug efflux system membrane fusion protein
MMRRLHVLSVLALSVLATLGCRQEPVAPAEAPPQPVRTEEARLEPFAPRLLLYGTVEAGSSAEVLALVAGVVGYPAGFPDGLRSGREVRRDEELARIANEAVERELREARLQAESAHSELDRHRRAFAAGVESEAQLETWRVASRLAEERLRAAEREVVRLTLRSPMAGRLVVETPVAAGAEVRAGTMLARVVGNGARRVAALAAAEELKLLAPGQGARLRVPGEEEPVAEAVVAEIPPGLDDGGAARVVLDVVSDRGLPLPGAGVEVEVELTERGLALTVPEEAVRFARGGSSLFVVGKQQGVGRPVARRRAVRLGARGDGRVEVLDGLRPGDRVIVSGVGFLDDEQQVEEVRDVEDAASAVGAGAAEGEP